MRSRGLRLGVALQGGGKVSRDVVMKVFSRTFSIAAVAFFPALPAAGQEVRDVVGRVLSERDSAAIAGVHVQVPSLGIGTTSDVSGTFVLNDLPRTRLEIVLGRIGVVADTVALEPGRDSLVVYLRSAAVQLDPVTTEARPEARARFEETVQPSVVNIDRETINRNLNIENRRYKKATRPTMPVSVKTLEYCASAKL